MGIMGFRLGGRNFRDPCERSEGGGGLVIKEGGKFACLRLYPGKKCPKGIRAEIRMCCHLYSLFPEWKGLNRHK